MNARTVLIGLDGATFHILDDLMARGIMPHLQAFLTAGVRGELQSVIPALTPPAWTSLITGRSPGQHGVFDFFQKQAPESHLIRFVTSRDIACESLWSIVNRHGMRAMALNFPLTFPPPALDGYVVPGWMPWRQLRLGCHPADLYDRLKALPGFVPQELAMDMAHEEKALEGCDQDEYESWIDLHVRREQQWFRVLEHLWADEPCQLVTVLFDGVDKLQHLFWRFLDPDYLHTLTEPWEACVRDQCLKYFQQLDTLLGKIVRLSGVDATVIVASDHGFGPQVRTFFVNAWLAEQGYLTWADHAGPPVSDGQLLGIGQIARHEYLLDWTHTVAYAPLPSGNGIHIVRADAHHPHGVPADQYETLRDRLIAELRQIKDPATGEQVISAVWKREEVFAGPHMQLAPDLTLVLADGGLVSILAADGAVRRRLLPTGTHRAEGVFGACGPEIGDGYLEMLSILDVAPLILHSLGLPIPDNLEGRVPVNALKPDAVRTRPVVTVPWSEADGNPLPTRPSSAPVLDQEAEEEILQRLRALGYVE